MRSLLNCTMYGIIVSASFVSTALLHAADTGGWTEAEKAIFTENGRVATPFKESFVREVERFPFYVVVTHMDLKPIYDNALKRSLEKDALVKKYYGDYELFSHGSLSHHGTLICKMNFISDNQPRVEKMCEAIVTTSAHIGHRYEIKTDLLFSLLRWIYSIDWDSSRAHDGSSENADTTTGEDDPVYVTLQMDDTIQRRELGPQLRNILNYWRKSVQNPTPFEA